MLQTDHDSELSVDNVTEPRPKVPLAEAARFLSELCDLIDDGHSPEGALLAWFNDSRLALADAVDRRIAFDYWIKGQIEMAVAAKADWDAELKKRRALYTSFKANTLAVVEANPDLPFQGRLGKIGVQNNAPKVALSFQEKNLTPALLENLKIRPEFYRAKYEINKDEVKTAIMAGEDVPWATLIQDKQVRIRK